MLAYLRLEILRVLRDRYYFFFSLALPVGFYLLWSSMFRGSGNEPLTGLPIPVYVMVSMASYGAIGTTLTTTGMRLAAERQSGWLRQLRVTPLRARTVIIVKALAAMTMALPAILLVGLAGALFQGVRLEPGAWLGMIALMWLGTLPFAALGTLIGSLVGADASQPLTVGLHMLLSLAGGLWLPVFLLPKALQTVSSWLPSNRFAEMGQDVAAGHAPSATAGLVLLAWTVALGGLAVAAYRRATVSA